MKRNIAIILTLILCVSTNAFSQGYLHVNGKSIVNEKNENVILRGIGTGNWMLQEGYMMKSSGVAGTQHEFRKKLIETIGEERTNQFYATWLDNHFTKTDVDSMKAWGFNSIRVAMHYKWFTPPIEEEPVAGEITWLNKGFEMIDNLLAWCSANQMYLILDLHGAPGGQGKDAAISDYDPSKPSLWENELNKAKTVALWKKLAERYNSEPWIGGYDLINEINWSFNDNNAQIRKLYGQITNAIREVDQNHIIIIEGNWFANDFTGLTPAWDANMVYSFHKYWNYNDADALKWITDIREQTNRPIWLGETGENSNTWFTNLVALAEKNNIGWSWWPVKKSGINNILRVETNNDYSQLIEVWKGNGVMSSDAAFNAVMTFADNHRFENCTIAYDVIDALIRQPKTTATLPFKKHKTGEIIFASDYDLGRNNYAYFDSDTADYHLNTNTFGNWNTGWAYRSDGVDIEPCENEETTNGFNVGWTIKGEWMQYTIHSEQEGAYHFSIRTASETGGKAHLEADGKIASESFDLPKTGNWENWQTTTVDGIILPQGETKVKLVFDEGGSNINYFSFTNPVEVSAVAFQMVSTTTAKIENALFVNLNKTVTSTKILVTDFQVIVNSSLAKIIGIKVSEENNQQIEIQVDQTLFSDDNIRLTYKGTSVVSQSQLLEKFTAKVVNNQLLPHQSIPGKIESEDFIENHGFELEECKDDGGGLNTAYANDGDYLDYLVYVDQAGTYQANFRVAAKEGEPEILIMNSENDRMVVNKLLKITATGDWQNWRTQSTTLKLPAGKYLLRILSRKGEYNLNWMEFNFITGKDELETGSRLNAYPNPASDSLWLYTDIKDEKTVEIFDLSGKKIAAFETVKSNIFIVTRKYAPGMYVFNVSNHKTSESIKIQISK